MAPLAWLTETQALTPHGFCLLWEPALLWLNAFADGAIMAAYYSIPLAIFWLVRHRPTLPHRWVASLFAIFIVACGSTHALAILTLWVPAYHAEVALKLLTAGVSVITAIVLWPLVRRLPLLPSFSQLETLNQTLRAKIAEQDRTASLLRESEQQLIVAQLTLQQSYDTLEHRVAERTEELVRLNAHISRNEARFRGVVEAAPSGMILIRADGRIDMVNARTEAMFGYTRVELLEQPIEMLIPSRLSDAHQALWEHFLKVAETPQMFSGQRIFARAKDGREFEVEIGLNPLETDEGQRVLAAVVDVSERRRMEAEVEAGRIKMISAARLSALGSMAGGIAHEINNPLAVIHALASNLEELADEGEVPAVELRRTTRRIVEHTDRIGKIVQSMRRIGRDGNLDPFSEVSLRETVVHVLDLCSERFKSHGVALRCDPIDPAIRITCREVQVSQILVNLLHNAFDAVMQETGDKWVRLAIETSGNVVKLAVIDCGRGVPAELKSRIMDPFFTTKPVGEGTGLGLSLSKQIAEEHGGALDVTESASGNTCFVLTLSAVTQRMALCS